MTETPRGTSTLMQRKKLGTVGQELVVDGDRQPTTTESRGQRTRQRFHDFVFYSAFEKDSLIACLRQ